MTQCYDPKCAGNLITIAFCPVCKGKWGVLDGDSAKVAKTIHTISAKNDQSLSGTEGTQQSDGTEQPIHIEPSKKLEKSRNPKQDDAGNGR